MKKFLYIAAAAIAALSACTKAEIEAPETETETANAPVFTATIEGDAETKTQLVEGTTAGKLTKVNWENTDKVSINGAVYAVTPGAEDATKATLTKESGSAPTGTYKAYYPASMYSAETATLPASYTYAAGKFNMPMYAESETTELGFQNICGVLAIKVTSAEMAKVTKITVTSDKAISGPCTIALSGEKYAATATGEDNANKTVTLDCGAEGVTPTAEGTIFYLPVPVITGAQLYIHVVGTINPTKAAEYAPLLYTQAMNASSVDIARNMIYNINFKTSLAKFTVQAADAENSTPAKTVNFTNGNLQATYSTATSSYTWGFAAHQYDYIGGWGNTTDGTDTGVVTGNNTIAGQRIKNEDNTISYISATQTDGAVVDLFCWSAKKDNFATTVHNYGIAAGGTNYDYYGVTFLDWGGKFEGKNYYTLSWEEWKTLLNISGTESGARTQTNRFALAKVNGLTGLLIFPDNYNATTPVAGTGLSTVNTASFSSVKYAIPAESIPEATWATMESAGVVFLPAAKCRNILENGFWGVPSLNIGKYWSSTQKNTAEKSGSIHYLYINGTQGEDAVTIHTYSPRSQGCSVRLVK